MPKLTEHENLVIQAQELKELGDYINAATYYQRAAEAAGTERQKYHCLDMAFGCRRKHKQILRLENTG